MKYMADERSVKHMVSGEVCGKNYETSDLT